MQKQLSQLARRCNTQTQGRVVVVHASGPSSKSPPPSPAGGAQLDRVLRRAAGKLRLNHPATPPPKKQEHDAGKKPSVHAPSNGTNRKTTGGSTTRKPQPQRKQTRRRDPVGDDDALFNGITERERDSVWDAIYLEVEGASSGDFDDDLAASSSDSSILPSRRWVASDSSHDDSPSTAGRPAAPPSQSSKRVVSSSGFQGFGAPAPRRSGPEGAASASTTSAPPAAPSTSSSNAASAQVPEPAESQQPQQQQEQNELRPPKRGQGRSQHWRGPLRAFLYNAEESLTRSLLVQLGLADRVEVVSDLRSADLILAAKLTRTGKHVNLAQGERTATNAKVPFVVVGRNMTADNLRVALEPLLELDPAAAAEAVAARASATRVPSPEEIRTHRLNMAYGFTEMFMSGP